MKQYPLMDFAATNAIARVFQHSDFPLDLTFPLQPDYRITMRSCEVDEFCGVARRPSTSESLAHRGPVANQPLGSRASPSTLNFGILNPYQENVNRYGR